MTSAPSSAPGPRLGFCCKLIPEEPPGGHKTLKAAKDAAMVMNVTTVTIAHLRRLDPAAAREKLTAVVTHNLAAMERQVAWVAARPPLERLLRLASSILPGYTHPEVCGLYADPDFRRAIEAGLAKVGEAARAGGVRLSMHPGPFCILASRNPAALENGIAELDYHAEVMEMMGYGGGWHPHGAHVNIHVGARDPGVDAFRENLDKVSQVARDLVTVENDESAFGLDEVLRLADRVPVVLDLHHHWIHSRGGYIAPDDPRIARVIESWRGVRPVGHVSVSREDVLPGHDPDALPDFAALTEAGLKGRDLAAHSDMMWNRAFNDYTADHLAWCDIEVEAKFKNLASTGLALHVGPVLSGIAPAVPPLAAE